MAVDERQARLAGQLGGIAFLAKALSDENRLRILLHVSGGKKSVTQIAESMNLSQPLVSHHLRELKRALLVEVQRQGPFVYYGLSRPDIIDVLEAIRALAGCLISERKGF